MHIKILGTGCPNCQRLEANTKQAITELNLDATLEKVTEIEKIMSYGVMSTPAVVVDETVIFFGMVPSIEDLKEKLKTF